MSGVGIWVVPHPSKLEKRVRVPHPAPKSVMDECDFCSSANVIRRYECIDFNAESRDAGVLYDGTNVVLRSTSYWAACAECSAYVEREDLDGLLRHVITVFQAQERLNPLQLITFASHARHSYQLFFRYRIRVTNTEESPL